jgi:hypothetical protein
LVIPDLVIYILLGLVGGVTYVLAPPRTDTKPDALKQIGLGAIAGGIAYFIVLSTAPAELGAYATYLAVIGVGYIAEDFLKKLFGGGSGGGDGSIPATGGLIRQ